MHIVQKTQNEMEAKLGYLKYTMDMCFYTVNTNSKILTDDIATKGF